MFKGHPKGLYALALANTGERFGYYTMLAIFVLFLQAKFGYNEAQAGNIYGIFLGCVYFMPLIGGMLADRFGYGKMVGHVSWLPALGSAYGNHYGQSHHVLRLGAHRHRHGPVQR